ncbi:MAG: phosphotransferase [Xanthomonadales bacterium]|nr:phosphotransferase [Gammaproteobacteria bacterium]MBT8053043.1 phosphotransferase [Gammaproteobacteria bacterium]NND56713.1 phosphotransferase [Xanthomonadales bacterium]NNK52698.1 phosphotransferase [Xanthomonadales bacterium]
MNETTPGSAAPEDSRELEAARWAAGQTGLDLVTLKPVSGDASFRRYFRFMANGEPIILMDAPPDKENSMPFVDIARRLRRAGLNAPDILQFDLERGFGLLEDFGDTLYRELINTKSVDQHFPELLDILSGMAVRVDTTGLPAYDDAILLQELDLFKTWYLERHKQRALDADERRQWNHVCRLLINSAGEQPQVFVHKDFHSCNLLQTPSGPGIIDFQDGLLGPVSYDFVSLIWDRYIAWPRGRIEGWMRQAREALPVEVSASQWTRHCDWMGLQRNLKIVGIFARLGYRDDKQGYIEMIPRFYQYLLDVLPLYPEFNAFRLFLEQPECAP